MEHAHILTARLIAKKTAERGEQDSFLTLDLADAFGSMQYPEPWHILHERSGPAGALAKTKLMCGHPLAPHWLGLAGVCGPVPVYRDRPRARRCRTSSWMAPFLRLWQRKGRGVCLLSLVAGNEERRPRMWADVSQRCNHLAFADDRILVAQIPRTSSRCTATWKSCVLPRGFTLSRKSSNFGAIAQARLGTACGWLGQTFGPSSHSLPDSLSARLPDCNVCAPIPIPFLAWGSIAWHLRKEVLSAAGCALVRMVILALGEPCGTIGMCAPVAAPGPS